MIKAISGDGFVADVAIITSQFSYLTRIDKCQGFSGDLQCFSNNRKWSVQRSEALILG